MKKTKIKDALFVLKHLGMPDEQQNERSALSLLALLNLAPDSRWADAEAPLMGITPIMEWMKENYGKTYKPNTRETIRRATIHQFVAAGIAIYNPDNPERAVNSPHAVYQISPSALRVIVAYGSSNWDKSLKVFLKSHLKLIDQYAKPRKLRRVKVKTKGTEVTLSPGRHNSLIQKIIEDFAEYFVPDGMLVYVGDTESKYGYVDESLFQKLGIKIDVHGKMPDVIIHCSKRNWLLLIEAVTSHGPVDGKRHDELKTLFNTTNAGLVFVTAFATRSAMSRFIRNISWETEVWVAEAPTHLIHFNGSRFLGPYPSHQE